MKVLSLFDGISCAQQALKELGVKDLTYYASEIDKYAISITQKNHEDTIFLGDVTKIKANGNYWDNIPKLENIDLLIGGSPCQDLSIAKKGRQGLSGSRSGLFYEYVRILNEVKPKYFVLENVNSMPKEAKETITKELFGIEPIMINAALVSAQNRKRLFWVGKLVGDTYERVDISLPEDKGILLRDILEIEVDEKYIIKDTNNYERKSYGAKGKILSDELKSPTLQAAMGTCGGNNILIKDKSNTIRTSGRSSGINDKHNWDTIRIGQIGNGGQGERIYSEEGKSDALAANGGGQGAKTGLYAISVSEQVIGRKRQADGTFKRHLEPRDDDKSSALTSNLNRSLVQENEIIRKLTPIECERLQSLPDNYTEGVSNTQRYKALGNAFNVEVIKHILKHII